MYILNRRQRIQEFNKIAEINRRHFNERKVQAFSTGEETLYSKLEHQLVRVQEMLQGRSEEAERSRDEIQKLISQIAHQMRTPFDEYGNIYWFSGGWEGTDVRGVVFSIR